MPNHAPVCPRQRRGSLPLVTQRRSCRASCSEASLQPSNFAACQKHQRTPFLSFTQPFFVNSSAHLGFRDLAHKLQQCQQRQSLRSRRAYAMSMSVFPPVLFAAALLLAFSGSRADRLLAILKTLQDQGPGHSRLHLPLLRRWYGFGPPARCCAVTTGSRTNADTTVQQISSTSAGAPDPRPSTSPILT